MTFNQLNLGARLASWPYASQNISLNHRTCWSNLNDVNIPNRAPPQIRIDTYWDVATKCAWLCLTTPLLNYSKLLNFQGRCQSASWAPWVSSSFASPHRICDRKPFDSTATKLHSDCHDDSNISRRTPEKRCGFFSWQLFSKLEMTFAIQAIETWHGH